MSRTFVITGSASGIGQATSDLLRAAGNTVIGIDLRDAEVEADLSTAEGRQAAVNAAIEQSEDRIDAVIASAGLSAATPTTAAVNYFGAIGVLEGLRPTLAASLSPRAAVVSSMSSLQPNDPALVDAMLAGDEATALEISERLAQDEATSAQIYASSKRAVSRWVRRESITPQWAGAGIPLNAVAPGIVTTPMTKDYFTTPEGTAFIDAWVPMPLNSHQDPDSIANLLIWLTSVQNTHCAGQTIYCDGGSDAVLRGDDAWSWADERVAAYYEEKMADLQ